MECHKGFELCSDGKISENMTWISMFGDFCCPNVPYPPPKKHPLPINKYSRFHPRSFHSKPWILGRFQQNRGKSGTKIPCYSSSRNHGSVEHGCVSNISFLSFRVIFHFHDGRKVKKICPSWILLDLWEIFRDTNQKPYDDPTRHNHLCISAFKSWSLQRFVWMQFKPSKKTMLG